MRQRSRATRRCARKPNIVPIVEPEVLMDGSHTVERCEEVTNMVLDRVFSHLFAARVFSRAWC
jgi:fructose-bisphosphate aldolase class I